MNDELSLGKWPFLLFSVPHSPPLPAVPNQDSETVELKWIWVKVWLSGCELRLCWVTMGNTFRIHVPQFLHLKRIN